MSDLNKKVNQAIKLLKIAEESAVQKSIDRKRSNQSITLPYGDLTLAYSTGKDSDVVLRLAQMACIKFTPVSHATGLDPCGSIQHAKENNAVIIKPEVPFFKLMEQNGFPTRMARWCCRLLKEKYDSPVSLQGIRSAESTHRANRYKEPTVCRIYSKNERTEVFLPILDWNDKDVEDFIVQEHIKCHQHYYDEDGNFHVERRVGCSCCPLMSKKQRAKAFKEKPSMVKAYIRFGKRWWDSHPNANSRNKFDNIYDLFFQNVFCDTYAEYQKKVGGLFGKLDTKQYLEEYFKIDLP